MASTIYNKTTGAILFSSGMDNVPANKISESIPGSYNGQFYYVDVDTKQPMLKPPKPTDGNQYVWNIETKTWDIVTSP
jgi:hypothetical protein